jgi:hypothetical protein
MKVFAWLTDNLSDEGKPALMAIVGQGEESAWFLGEMLRTGGWKVQARPVGRRQQSKVPAGKRTKTRR